MTVIEQAKRSREPGSGAKGHPSIGLHYCSRCGKRGRNRESVMQHVRDYHGGDGQAIKEPTRKQMLKAFMAAEELARAAQRIVAGDSYAAHLERALAAYREATK